MFGKVMVGSLSLLALHLIWEELGSLSPLPHSHKNLGLVLQPIIYPGKHSKPAQAHENLLLDSLAFCQNRASGKCCRDGINQ